MTENGLNVWQIDVLHGSYTIPIATPALQAPRKILAFFLALDIRSRELLSLLLKQQPGGLYVGVGGFMPKEPMLWCAGTDPFDFVQKGSDASRGGGQTSAPAEW